MGYVSIFTTGGFRWSTKEEIDNGDLAWYQENGEKGIMLEGDLEYPKELHDSHNDYPLALEKLSLLRDH